MEELLNSPEFMSAYINTIFEDISGKNKELILLKANAKMFSELIENMKRETETQVVASKEEIRKLQDRLEELANIKIKYEELVKESELKKTEYDILKRNYDLVVAEHAKLRDDWENSDVTILPQTKKKKVKKNGEQIPA